MKKRRLKRYFSKSWRAIHRHANAYVQTQGGKKLHRMRVDIKQVFAIVHLLRACGHSSKIKLKALRRLYKTAGHIRDRLVGQQLLQGYQIEALAFKRGERKQLNRAFGKLLTSFLHKQEALHKHLLHQISSLKRSCVNREYAQQLQKAAQELAHKTGTTSWHSARRRVQFLTYLHPFASGTARSTGLVPNLYDLKELQQSLGQWHNIHGVETKLAHTKQAKPRLLRQLRTQRKELQRTVRVQYAGLLQ
jgi:hypothetical protein